MDTKILLVDDHRIVREGLRALLEKRPGMTIIAETGDGRSAIQLSCQFHPDVVIMDVGLPDLNGIDATREILSQVPGVRIIALSMHSDRRFVTAMLKAGALGYLLKDSAFKELREAIQAVMKNQIYLSPVIAQTIIKDYTHFSPKLEISAFSILTGREREVVQLLAEGRSTKEIASSLHISIKTVETHRQRIMEKLGLHSLAELTKYAVREGLTSIES